MSNTLIGCVGNLPFLDKFNNYATFLTKSLIVFSSKSGFFVSTILYLLQLGAVEEGLKSGNVTMMSQRSGVNPHPTTKSCVILLT
jgi:hypothetical protein